MSSEAADAEIERLRQELRVAQELLAGVLFEVGEPVVLKVEDLDFNKQGDRFIDLQLDKQANTWTLELVNASVEDVQG